MLKISNIGFRIRGRNLLQDINIVVRTGTFTAVMGANGAGKSTLLKILSGDIRPSAGTVSWNGQDLGSYPVGELSRKRAVLRQQYNILLPFRAREIIEMGRYPHFSGKLTTHCKNVIKEVAAYVGVEGMMERNYLTLSGGEQQRVQLARVLVQVWDAPPGEKLIMLDEPVSALDIHYQHQLMALVKTLTENSFTVIAVLHDLNLAMQYADDVLLLKKGRSVAFGDKYSVMNEEAIRTTFDVAAMIHYPAAYGYPFITVNGQINNKQTEQSDNYVDSNHFFEGKI